LNMRWVQGRKDRDCDGFQVVERMYCDGFQVKKGRTWDGFQVERWVEFGMDSKHKKSWIIRISHMMDSRQKRIGHEMDSR